MNKLFPPPPFNNYNNLMIDPDSITHITTPDNAQKIVQIMRNHIPAHIDPRGLSICDGTACVGGDTIAFGHMFGRVVSIELNRTRYNMLANNIAIYGLDNIIPLNDDFVTTYPMLESLDCIYLDPPWGGSGYKTKTNLRLCIGNVYIDQIVCHLFSGTIRSNIKMVCIKLPLNYNLHELYENTKMTSRTMYMYKLPQMMIIVYCSDTSFL